MVYRILNQNFNGKENMSKRKVGYEKFNKMKKGGEKAKGVF